MIFHGALVFFVTQDRFSMKTIGFWWLNLFFQRECWSFWLQAFCKTVLWAFFPWNLKAILKAELVFKESHTFLQQGHCFSKDSFILDGRNKFFTVL